MIIHRYILRKTKDKGLIDRSETMYCCPEMQDKVEREIIKTNYFGVFEDNEKYLDVLTQCRFCYSPIKYKNHYVGEETLWKHVGSAFKGKVFV